MDFLIRDALKAPSLDAYLKKVEASGLTGISQDSARGLADDNIKRQEEAERKAKEAERRAKLDAQIAKLNSGRLAAEEQRAVTDQQRAAIQAQAALSTKKPSNGTGKLVGLAAAVAGVYFITKG
jgi:hypothetical protein